MLLICIYTVFCNIIQSSIWALLSDKTYIYGYQFSWFAHKRFIFGFIRDWTFNFFFLPVHILFMWSENQFCFLIFGCEHKKSVIFLQILPKFLVEKTAGSDYLFLASFRSKYFLIKFGNNFLFPESMFLRIKQKKYWISWPMKSMKIGFPWIKDISQYKLYYYFLGYKEHFNFKCIYCIFEVLLFSECMR